MVGAVVVPPGGACAVDGWVKRAMSDTAFGVGRPGIDERPDIDEVPDDHAPEDELQPRESEDGGESQDAQAPEGGDRAGGREMWRDWRPSVLAGFWTWIAGIAAYAMCTFVAWVPTPGNEPTLNNVMDGWQNWDTDWYTIIADLGYHIDGRSPAFFPLYPMLIRLVDPIVPGRSLPTALLISALAGLTALIMMHRLTGVFLGPEVAKRASFYLLAFPTGFFLVIAYNESLLIALALGSLYLMHRGKWAGAAILAAFASGTRTGGVLLAVPFVLEYLRQHGWSPRRSATIA